MTSFQFDSLQAFIWMDGHGPYVWAAYGITLAGLAFLALSPAWRRARILRQASSAAIRRSAAARTEQDR